MRNNLSRILAIVAIGLIALCVSPKPAQAQQAFAGRFTLDHAVRWSNALLPAGDYTFSMASAALPAKIILHGPSGSVILVTSSTSTRTNDISSSTTLERRGGTSFVSELYLAGLGVEFRYATPKLPNNEIAQGPSSTEHVLVAMARK